jgi:hypothetical protein
LELAPVVVARDLDGEAGRDVATEADPNIPGPILPAERRAADRLIQEHKRRSACAHLLIEQTATVSEEEGRSADQAADNLAG